MPPLTDVEIQAIVQLIQLAEPPIQHAIADLIGKIHKKQLTAQDYINLAQTLISKETAPATPSPAA